MLEREAGEARADAEMMQDLASIRQQAIEPS
jgi:hypothetical protein